VSSRKGMGAGDRRKTVHVRPVRADGPGATAVRASRQPVRSARQPVQTVLRLLAKLGFLLSMTDSL